jgi:hypothetical protein
MFSTFLRRFNVSSICSVGVYNRCAKKYVEYAKPRRWEYAIPGSYGNLKEAVESCRRLVLTCEWQLKAYKKS